MKKGIGTLVLFLIGFSACEEKIEPGQTLVHTLEFGKGNQNHKAFISQARSIALDSEHNIYVADMGLVEVKVFDINGKYLRTIGREGRGPGEFLGSFNIEIIDSTLIVHDFVGYKVLFFDLMGNFKESFKLEKYHVNPFVISDSVLITGFAGAPFQQELEEEPVFYKFTREGVPISQFGRFPGNRTNIPAMYYRSDLDTENGQLHVIYWFIPLYQVIDIETEKVLHEFDFSDFEPFMQYKENETLEGLNPNNFNDKTKDIVSYFVYIEVYGNRVFLLRATDTKNIMIDEFILDGGTLTHKETHIYLFRRGEFYGVLDFEYIPELDVFIVLEGYKGSPFVISKYEKVSNREF